MSAGLFKYVWPFTGPQTLSVKVIMYFLEIASSYTWSFDFPSKIDLITKYWNVEMFASCSKLSYVLIAIMSSRSPVKKKHLQTGLWKQCEKCQK